MRARAAIGSLLVTVGAACAASDEVTTPSIADADVVRDSVVEQVADTVAPSTSALPPSTARRSDTVESTDAVATTTAPSTDVADSSQPDPAACVDDLSVRERVALLVWPAVFAEDWPAAIQIVRDDGVGGVLLMSQEGLDGDEVARRLVELEAESRFGLIVATDEEGGDVQRLRDVAELDSQRNVSQDIGVDDAERKIAEHGELVRSLGVDMVLGPVVDVEPNVGDVPLEPSRFFDGPPEVVSAYAAAYLRGWNEAGVFAALKHYPGHGAASGDTHITDGVTPSLADLEQFDLKPYRDLVALARATDTAVMIGHLTVPGLTDGVPATRSPAAVEHLRVDLGYGDALLVTDALGMAAVGIPEPEASVLAISAGIDVVIFTLSSQTSAVIDALEAAVEAGRIDADHVDAAARKVVRMLARDGHGCATSGSGAM